MKLDAGGKLNSRKPIAAPATIAASTPGCSRPRSKAITAIAAAMIAQTPAASPSTPSEKLTTFIISTRPSTVRIGPALVAPGVGEVQFADERQRDRLHRHAVVHDDHRREDLAGELRRRVQVEAVIERADDHDHPRA